MRLPPPLIREKTASKAGLGTFYVHTLRWRPNTVHALGFQPAGRDQVHSVPEHNWDTVLGLLEDDRPVTYEQVMALIRRPAAGTNPTA